MLNKVYAIIGACLLAGYSATALLGYELFSSNPAKESKQSAHARHAGGRSIWFFGYRGGK